MSIETFNQFGGRVPRIYDARELAAGKAVTAKNCRFDHGGVMPLQSDTAVVVLPNSGPVLALFLYQGEYWLAWDSEVDAVLTPTANDEYNRVYYTEDGVLKVTDSTLFSEGGTAYPEKYLLPSPPAPVNAPTLTQYPIPVFEGGNEYAEPPTVFMAIVSMSLAAGVISVVLQYDSLAYIAAQTPILIHSTNTPLDGQEYAFSVPNPAVPTTINILALSGDPGPIVINQSAITAMAVGAATVCTSAANALELNDHVVFDVVGTGTNNPNGLTGTVTAVTTNTFTVSLNTTGFIFTSGTFSLVSRSFVEVPVAIAVSTSDAITRANPAQLTHNAHGLTTGAVLCFFGMIGMEQLVNQAASVTVIDANNFTLDGINSETYSPFVSGEFFQLPSLNIPRDPTLEQSRYYVETYVNQYGDEGPPTNASAIIDVYDGDTVTVQCNNVFATLAELTAAIGSYAMGSLAYVVSDPTPANNGHYEKFHGYTIAWIQRSPDPYGISYKNFYRSNIDDTGAEVLQLVPPPSGELNFPLSTITFADNVPAASLGEVLATSEWDGAPAGVTGLIATPGEGMACYTGNTLCLAVSGFPHAWPVSYQKAMEEAIMGLLAWGTTVVALTAGLPGAVTFTDPVNSVPEKLDSGYSCSSSASIVDMLTYFMYASSEGLIAIGPGMPGRVVTEELFSRQDWQAYQPDTIAGYMWEGKYLGFYGTGGTAAGFMFDPASKNWTDLDFYATAGYRDPNSGILYLQVGGNLVSFATATVAPRNMDWKSGWKLTKMTSFGAIKVLALAYPVVVDVAYPNMLDATGAPAPQTFTVTVVGPRPQRLPQSNTMVDTVQLRVYGSAGTTVVYLASTLEELPQ